MMHVLMDWPRTWLATAEIYFKSYKYNVSIMLILDCEGSMVPNECHPAHFSTLIVVLLQGLNYIYLS